MTYFYVKALHIIFVVTWFSGLFYIVRLFIYNREANDKPETERHILQRQFNIMIKRLWYGITWPSAILTLVFGSWMLYLYGSVPAWLLMKLVFVILLFLYHFSLHALFKQQTNGIFRYSSQQLRIWNEVATLFLIAIVFLVVVKQGISLVYGLSGLLLLMLIFILIIRLYKKIRNKKP